MIINKKMSRLANKYLIKVRKDTETVSEGEGLAMLLLWAFLLEHAEYQNMDIEELARHQFNAFLDFARENDLCMKVENKKTIN